MRGTHSEGRAPRVALLLETSTEYGRGLLRGVVRYSRLHGPWSLYLAPGHLAQVLASAKSWNGDGIIGRIRSPEMARAIRSTGIPFVASSLREWSPRAGRARFCEIRTNSPAIARMAADHLFALGLRQFAFCGFSGCPWSSLREEVFSRSVESLGFDCATHRIEISNWTHDSDWIRTWTREQPVLSCWLKSLQKPVGLMACNDVCGRGVLEACARAGLRVPDQVAVIGVDNDELICELSDPPLSSVALDLETAGYEAARLLDRLMSRRFRRQTVICVEAAFVQTRRSTDVIAVNDSLIVAALRFIRDHSAKAIDVASVARHFGTSRRTLERRFAQAIGRTILAEITRCRLERAKRLLTETGLPCSQVSLEAGFNSSKSFNRAFLRAERLTPRKFRQKTASFSGSK